MKALSLGILSLILFLKGCGFNYPKSSFSPSESNGSSDKTPAISSFSLLRTRIFIPKCSECHQSDIADYDFLIQNELVVPGSPSSSILYEKVRTGEMPQNGPPLSSEEVTAIYLWIQNGARND
ncbi:hypothetical protein EBT16_03415 [bacterium]|nr:hypothetical protein [bacterium]